jgi:hypothetical protein
VEAPFCLSFRLRVEPLRLTAGALFRLTEPFPNSPTLSAREPKSLRNRSPKFKIRNWKIKKWESLEQLLGLTCYLVRSLSRLLGPHARRTKLVTGNTFHPRILAGWLPSCLGHGRWLVATRKGGQNPARVAYPWRDFVIALGKPNHGRSAPAWLCPLPSFEADLWLPRCQQIIRTFR